MAGQPGEVLDLDLHASSGFDPRLETWSLHLQSRLLTGLDSSLFDSLTAILAKTSSQDAVWNLSLRGAPKGLQLAAGDAVRLCPAGDDPARVPGARGDARGQVVRLWREPVGAGALCQARRGPVRHPAPLRGLAPVRGRDVRARRGQCAAEDAVRGDAADAGAGAGHGALPRDAVHDHGARADGGRVQGPRRAQRAGGAADGGGEVAGRGQEGGAGGRVGHGHSRDPSQPEPEDAGQRGCHCGDEGGCRGNKGRGDAENQRCYREGGAGARVAQPQLPHRAHQGHLDGRAAIHLLPLHTHAQRRGADADPLLLHVPRDGRKQGHQEQDAVSANEEGRPYDCRAGGRHQPGEEV